MRYRIFRPDTMIPLLSQLKSRLTVLSCGDLHPTLISLRSATNFHLRAGYSPLQQPPPQLAGNGPIPDYHWLPAR